jgi:hypothetical protein
VANAVYTALQTAAGLGSQAQQTIQGALLDELGSLSGSISQGIGLAQQSLQDVISGVEGGIGSALGGIGTTIGNQIFQSLNPVATALSTIAIDIAHQIGGLAGAIASAVAAIIPQIIEAVENPVGALKGVLQDIEQVLTGQITGITTQVGSIATTLGGLGTTLDQVLLHYETWNQAFVESQTGYPDGGTLHKDLSGLAEALAGLITTVAASPVYKTSDFIQTECHGVNLQKLLDLGPRFGDPENSTLQHVGLMLWSWVLNVARVIPTVLKYWDDYKHLIDQECPTDRLPVTAVVEAVQRGFLTVNQGQSEAAQQNLNNDRFKVLMDLAVNQMTPAQLVEAKYRQIITDADYHSALTAQGWTPGQIDTLSALNIERFTVDVLGSLRRRGLIDNPTMKAALQSLQFDQTQQDALIKLVFRPENTSEAIDGVASQDALSAIGLPGLVSDTAIPEYVSVAAQNEGLDANTTALRWASHWNVGAIGSWITLYFRGMVPIETLNAVMSKNFIPPNLIPSLVEAARPIVQYRTISNMLRIGQIDVQTAGKLLMQHGYSQENAQLLITYAQRPGASSAAKKAQSLHAVSLGIAKREYIDGAISETDYYQILLQHGYTVEGANAEIAVERANQAMLVRKENAQLIIDEYGAGLINEQTALAQLAVLGLTVYEIAKYTHKIRAFRVKAAKHPTEAELNDFRKNGIISDAEYSIQLHLIGYTEQVAGWFTSWRTQTTAPPASSSATPTTPTGGKISGSAPITS